MPNPNPKTEHLRKFVPIGDRPLAEKALSVRVDVDVDAAIRALGDERSAWMRRVLTEAAQAELMKGDREVSVARTEMNKKK